MSLLLHTLRAALPERDSLNIPLILTTSVATLSLFHLTRLALRSPSPSSPSIIRGPSTTSPASLAADAAYPPDALPGGRDVASPYGNVRVYEWGPEEGRKVLLVHGITTPCLALGAVAHGLVDKGCRVMLFDLFGRGYSDNPSSVPQDIRLYSTQILLVLTSSHLSWTTAPGFDLLGYSLGGGIATAFAAYFPAMVRSLLLIAPAGLIRPQHLSERKSALLYSGFIPESLLVRMCKRRLVAGALYAKENKADSDVLGAEVPGGEVIPPLSRTHPHISVISAVQWQLRHHSGFVHAFLSSIRNAPITGQEAAWRMLRDARADKVLLVAATADPIVLPQEIREDAEALLGRERIVYVQVEAAHDFPITDPGDVLKAIEGFWEGA